MQFGKKFESVDSKYKIPLNFKSIYKIQILLKSSNLYSDSKYESCILYLYFKYKYFKYPQCLNSMDRSVDGKTTRSENIISARKTHSWSGFFFVEFVQEKVKIYSRRMKIRELAVISLSLHYVMYSIHYMHALPLNFSFNSIVVQGRKNISFFSQAKHITASFP